MPGKPANHWRSDLNPWRSDWNPVILWQGVLRELHSAVSKLYRRDFCIGKEFLTDWCRQDADSWAVPHQIFSQHLLQRGTVYFVPLVAAGNLFFLHGFRRIFAPSPSLLSFSGYFVCMGYAATWHCAGCRLVAVFGMFSACFGTGEVDSKGDCR